MGGKSPKAPDYKGAAIEQAKAEKELTTAQTYANRPTLTTPWGTQTWETGQGVDPATGQKITTWASDIALSPQQQEALDSQMAVQTGRSQGAEALLRNSLSGFGIKLGPDGQPISDPTQIDYSGIKAGAGDGLDSSNFNFSLGPQGTDWRQKGQDAALAFQRPLQQERQAALESQLANMGLTRGSEAWNRESRNLQDQNARDNLQAFSAGQSESELQQRQALASAGFSNDAALKAGSFNQQLRQQQIAELLSKRAQPLNELNALLTGQQVSTPQMPSFNSAGKSEAPQLLNAANSQYQANLDAFNAKQQGLGSIGNGLFSLGSAYFGAPT